MLSSDSSEYAENQTVVKPHLMIASQADSKTGSDLEIKRSLPLAASRELSRIAKTLEKKRPGRVTRMNWSALIRFAVGNTA